MADLFRKGLAAVRLRPVLLSVLGIGFIYGLYSEGWDRLWVKYLVDNFTLPQILGLNEVAFFGLLRAGGMLLSIVVTRQVEKRLDANHAPSIARAMLWITVLLAGAIFTFAYSPALAIIQALQDAGAKVRAYDPEGMEQAAKLLDNVTYCNDAYEAMDGAAAAVIVTEWDAFRALDFNRMRELLTEPLLVDLRNLYSLADIRRHGFRYVAVGREA